MQTATGGFKTVRDDFIECSRSFLTEDYMPKLLRCLDSMTEEDVWWRPNEVSNSAGNLILHLTGNLRQWIVSSIGGVPFARDRDAEFASRGPVSREELKQKLQQVVREVDRVVEQIQHDGLLKEYHIQKFDVTALRAVFHVVEHFSYHLGQILYIYKLRTGRDLRFYEL